jgi:RNA polymerase sigma-70 factor (ECF subfamily)
MTIRRLGDDAVLLDLHGLHGESAVRALYRTYGSELYGFAFNRLRDHGLAEEVVQEVFTRVWQRAGEFDASRGAPKQWLYGIARNAVIDAARHRARRPPLAHYDVRPDEQPVHEPIDAALICRQAHEAFDGLTAEHQEMLRLRTVAGLNVREIAAVTGLAEGTVKSRTHYAMRTLRLALEDIAPP